MGEYTQGTSCPLKELHRLRITVTITSVVSAVTPVVWIPDFTPRLDFSIPELAWEQRVNTNVDICIITHDFDSYLSLLEETHVRVSFRSCEYKYRYLYHHARF